jgi:putative flippase GtrA
VKWSKLQFVRFVIAGGVAAAANFGSRFLFSLWVPFEWAVVFAYVVGMIVAFSLMRAFVFNAGRQRYAPQAVMFTVVNLLALAQTLAVSVILIRWILPRMGVVEGAEAIAHLIGVLVPVVTSYFGHLWFTFNPGRARAAGR